MINKIKLFFQGFIPRYINNNIILFFLRLFGLNTMFSKKSSKENLYINNIQFKKHIENINKFRGYIENQHRYEDMNFGRVTVDYAGCEVIAVYNALKSLNNNADFPELLSYFEQRGMIFSGYFGTMPQALYRYFIKKGYKTLIVCSLKKMINIIDQYDTFILTYFNDGNNIMSMVHTINISKDSNGYLTAHNAYCNGKVIGPYKDLPDLFKHIHNGRIKAISLIGINKLS